MSSLYTDPCQWPCSTSHFPPGRSETLPKKRALTRYAVAVDYCWEWFLYESGNGEQASSNTLECGALVSTH